MLEKGSTMGTEVEDRELMDFPLIVADVVAECNYAQRRALTMRTAPDAHLADGGKAPDEYAEFLFRTSGVLMHEPAAGRRAHGQPVG